MQPLQKRNIIKAKDIQDIFSLIETVLKINQLFLDDLRHR